MLRDDSLDTAHRAALDLQADRLVHFHDPRRRVGKAIAPRLNAGRAVVWDVYLYFPVHSRWEDAAPSPEDWAHQLEAEWADVARYRRGDDLTRWLDEVSQSHRG